MNRTDIEWVDVEEELSAMSLEELESFLPVVEALGRAKSTGFLFEEYEILQ